MTIEKVGLEAIFKTDAFMKGIKSYISGLDKVDDATSRVAASLEDSFGFKLMRTLGIAAERMLPMAEATRHSAHAFKGLGFAATTLAFALGRTLFEAVKKVTSGILDFAKGGLMMAARAQQMDFILQVLGNRVGKTREEMNAAVESVQEYGIRLDVAQTLVQDFTRYQLDLAKATDLARVAQDTATLANVDSSGELARILVGLQKLDTEMLRFAGITIPSAQQAYDIYGKEIGKAASAMSHADKMNALLNATLLEGAKNAGLYEASMEAVSKQLGSLTGREIPELARVMSTQFVPAFGEAIKAARETVSAFGEALDEGGKLEDEMINLGAAAAVATEGFRTLAKRGTDAIIEFLDTADEKFGEQAEKALEWGINTATQFATGLIQGAAAAITAAMRFIGNILSSWLSSKSPPKIAPDIGRWGAAAMTEYLEGWKLADFSVFSDLAGLVSRFLSSLGDDIIPKEQLIPRILGTREAIAEAINTIREVGAVTDEIIDGVMKAAGNASDAFRGYITALFGVEEASLKVAHAQQEVNEISAAYSNILSFLNRQLTEETDVLEENQRLRQLEKALASGLLTKEEKARAEAEKRQIMLRKQIRTVEDQRDVEVSAAKGRLDVARQDEVEAKERLARQQALINIQIEQNSLIEEQLNLLEKLAEISAGAGGEGFLGDLEDIGLQAGGAITSGISKAFEDAKERIRKKIEEMFQPVRDAYEADIKPVLEDLSETWDWMTGLMQQFWEERVSPIWETLGGQELWDTFIENLGKVGGAAIVAAVGIGVLNIVIGLGIAPVILLAAAIAFLISLLEVNETQLRTTWFQAYVIFWWALNEAQLKVSGLSESLWEKLVPSLEDTEDVMDALWKKIKIDVLLAFIDFIDWVDELAESIDLEGGLNTALENLLDWADKVAVEIETHVKTALSYFTEHVLTPMATGLDTVGGAVEGVYDWLVTLWNFFKNKDWSTLFDVFLPGSPPPLAAGFNEIADSIKNLSNFSLPNLEHSFRHIMVPSSVGVPSSSNITNNTKTIQIFLSPSYEQVQSPTSLSFDLETLLARTAL